MGCRQSRGLARAEEDVECRPEVWLAVPTVHSTCASKSIISVRGKLHAKAHGQLPLKLVGMHSNHGIKPMGAKSRAKINQDVGIVSFPFASSQEQVLLGVFDGHGAGGEIISKAAALLLVEMLEADAERLGEDTSGCMRDQLALVNKMMRDSEDIASSRCGTTAIVALLRAKSVSVACIGDSRCVLATLTPDGTGWSARELSIDQKPDDPVEKARIQSAGSFVSPGSAVEPARVWESASASKQKIGHNLAMARAIGDHGLTGISARAELTETQLWPADECLILASDGVWEFISSQEAVNVCYEHRHDATEACHALITKATQKWRVEEVHYRDDITAIVIFLPVLPALQSRVSLRIPATAPLRDTESAGRYGEIRNPTLGGGSPVEARQPAEGATVSVGATVPATKADTLGDGDRGSICSTMRSTSTESEADGVACSNV